MTLHRPFFKSLTFKHDGLSQENHQPYKITDFELGLSKGSDSYGTIYPARHLKTGFVISLKIVHKKHVRDLESFIRVLKIQSFLDSERNVQIYGIFSDEKKIYILMEYF